MQSSSQDPQKGEAFSRVLADNPNGFDGNSDEWVTEVGVGDHKISKHYLHKCKSPRGTCRYSTMGFTQEPQTQVFRYRANGHNTFDKAEKILYVPSSALVAINDNGAIISAENNIDDGTSSILFQTDTMSEPKKLNTTGKRAGTPLGDTLNYLAQKKLKTSIIQGHVSAVRFDDKDQNLIWMGTERGHLMAFDTTNMTEAKRFASTNGMIQDLTPYKGNVLSLRPGALTITNKKYGTTELVLSNLNQGLTHILVHKPLTQPQDTYVIFGTSEKECMLKTFYRGDNSWRLKGPEEEFRSNLLDDRKFQDVTIITGEDQN